MRPRKVLKPEAERQVQTRVDAPLIVRISLDLIVRRWRDGGIRGFSVARVSAEQQVRQGVAAVLGSKRCSGRRAGAVGYGSAIAYASVFIFVAVDIQRSEFERMVAAHPRDVVAQLPTASIDRVG